MILTTNCSLSITNSCSYNIAGIKEVYISSTKDSEFIVDSNIILDIINVTWYKLGVKNFKITQNISKNSEEIIVDFQIPYLDSVNKLKISSLKNTKYSFLILTNENELFFIENTSNQSIIETYNPNGFTLKQTATSVKSLFQVDYNYYLFNFIGVQDTVDVCSSYYNDLALTSVQPNALLIQCLVEDYAGF